MDDAERIRLLGKYRPPRFRIGQRVSCLVRGEMVITGMTDAPIPWPAGKPAKLSQTCGSTAVLRYAPQNSLKPAVIPLFFALCRKCSHRLANNSE
jgi:hypothetical protein